MESQTEIVSEREETYKSRIFFQTKKQRINIGKVTRTMKIVERYFESSLFGIFPRKTIALEKWTSILQKSRGATFVSVFVPVVNFSGWRAGPNNFFRYSPHNSIVVTNCCLQQVATGESCFSIRRQILNTILNNDRQLKIHVSLHIETKESKKKEREENRRRLA